LLFWGGGGEKWWARGGKKNKKKSHLVGWKLFGKGMKGKGGRLKKRGKAGREKIYRRSHV